MICLDTNAVIAAINQRSPFVRQHLEESIVAGVAIGLPTVVLFELRYGIAKSTRPKENTAVLAAFLMLDIAVWPFAPEDAEEAGQIRAELERADTPIGPYDILIAAQARRRGAILVTANTSEFARVPALKSEDWSAG